MLSPLVSDHKNNDYSIPYLVISSSPSTALETGEYLAGDAGVWPK